MREKLEIDGIDRKILEYLQQDAQLPIQSIAERVGLTTNPCWRRIRRMEQEGIIEKRTAVISAEKIGLGITVFVMLKTEQHTRGWLESFKSGIEDISEIVECHRMAGEVDYMLKVLVRDLKHYDKVYQRLIDRVPGLKDVSSTFSMERLKQSASIDVRTASAV